MMCRSGAGRLALVILWCAGCGADDVSTPVDPGAADGRHMTPRPGVTQDAGDVGEPDGSEPSPSVFVPECQMATDCSDEDAVCTCEGQCLVPEGQACVDSINCGTSHYCDPCTGHCAPRGALCEPCMAQGSCMMDGACIPYASGGTYCGYPCLSDVGCQVIGPGYSCVALDAFEVSQCVPKSGDCAELGLCEEDAECPGAQICNAAGSCADGCTEDGQCAVMMVCVQGHCVEPCSTDADCEGEAICESDGHCKVEGECAAASDCPMAETYCDLSVGTCVPGCQTDDHCQDATLECESGECVVKGCQHNYQCAFAEVCHKETGECVASPEAHCADCVPGDDAACTETGGICVGLQDADGNEKGDFCFQPCVEDPIDSCPQGYACQQIDLGDGSQPGFFCVRSCWVDPVSL